MKFDYVRHGDAPFQKLDESIRLKLEKMKSKLVNKLVTNLGEIHGHSHDVIPAENTEIVEYFEKDQNGSSPNDELIYFEIKNGPAFIFHEEHKPIILNEGIYVRTAKREYNPFTDELVRVRD